MNTINHAENLQQNVTKIKSSLYKMALQGIWKKKHEDILVTYYKDNVVTY
jgi:hypothetical protein